MKKTIIAFATFALLTTGAMAQRGGYNSDYGQNRYPGPPAQRNPHADDAQEAFRIDQLDQIVNLSHRQKKDLQRIENNYDRQALSLDAHRNPQAFRQAEMLKRQDMLAVLNSGQRNALFNYQQASRGNAYGQRGPRW